MNSQLGISIAAVAVAIVSIGISAGLVSSMNQDMAELRSTIENLSSVSQKMEIEQQAITKDGIIFKTQPLQSDDSNTQSESQPSDISDNIKNVPRPLTLSEEIEELKSKDKKLRQKLGVLEDRLGEIKLVGEWNFQQFPLNGNESFRHEIECPNENDFVVSVYFDNDELVTFDNSIFSSTDYAPAVSVNNDGRLAELTAIVWACAHVEIPDVTTTTDRPGMEQQAMDPVGMGNIPKGLQEDKTKTTQKNLPFNPLKSSEQKNPMSKPTTVLDHDICGDGIDNDSDGQIDEIEAPRPGVNWSFCNLSNQDYSNENLKGAKLIRTSGSNVNLHGADFTNAVLINSIFTNSDLVAMFVNANLRGVTMEHSNFNGAHLINSTLNNGDFNHSTFDGASLQGASIRSSQFNDASLVNANLENVVGFGNGSFERANLSDVNLKHANLQQWTLTEADITISDLSYADFNGVDSTYTDYSDSNLHAFDGGWGDFSYSKFINTDLSGARLTAANFIMADFTDADLTSAQMVYANLIDSNLSGVDLSYANLSGADLTGADLTDAVLIGTNLISSNLNEVNLSGADLTGADLTDAILSCIGHPICN